MVLPCCLHSSLLTVSSPHKRFKRLVAEIIFVCFIKSIIYTNTFTEFMVRLESSPMILFLYVNITFKMSLSKRKHKSLSED